MVADPAIRTVGETHRVDRLHLESPYRGRVNTDIPTTDAERWRNEDVAGPKCIDTSSILNMIAFTVIKRHLAFTARGGSFLPRGRLRFVGRPGLAAGKKGATQYPTQGSGSPAGEFAATVDPSGGQLAWPSHF